MPDRGIAPNIVNIVGGLGNQLFQYLFGRALESHTGRPTVYDTSAFEGAYKRHKLTIERTFDLKLPRVEDDPLARVPVGASSYLALRIVGRMPGIRRLLFPRLHLDDGRTAWDSSDRAYRPEYFFGTWQSQVYPEGFLPEQAGSLRFSDEALGAARSAEAAYGPPAPHRAAIHIRLGDYLASAAAPQLPLDEGYYRTLMQTLRNERGITEFVVFSDQIGLIKHRWFKDEPAVFVDGYADQGAAGDLCYMAGFSTLGISASTFGWWSAVLGGRDTVAYFPTPWTRAAFAKRPEHRPFIPAHWQAVSSDGFDLGTAPDLKEPAAAS